MKHLLHLNSYYVDTHLYSKIYKKLAVSFKQSVYIPIKEGRNEDNNMSILNTDLFFSRKIKKYHSILYFKKIKKLSDDIEERGLFRGIDTVHAHNLFIDGAIALNLKKKYGLKYVVSVRMTDIAMQYKYMRHRRAFAREILAEAEQIIFISPLYKERLYGMMKSEFVSTIENKTLVLPNGIDDFWLESSSSILSYKRGQEPFRLLYIGQLIKRKNLDKILNALERINKDGEKITLKVIGGEYQSEKKFYLEMVERMKGLNFVEFKGVIRDQRILKDEIGNSHALVMPSLNELFGLVFIEAISQNTPVLYPNNEGITPYLNNKKVGVDVDPRNELDIEDGILKLERNYDSYGVISHVAKEFDWNIITEEFSKLYKKNLNEQD